jgi:hypothetical protein
MSARRSRSIGPCVACNIGIASPGRCRWAVELGRVRGGAAGDAMRGADGTNGTYGTHGTYETTG